MHVHNQVIGNDFKVRTRGCEAGRALKALWGCWLMQTAGGGDWASQTQVGLWPSRHFNLCRHYNLSLSLIQIISTSGHNLSVAMLMLVATVGRLLAMFSFLIQISDRSILWLGKQQYWLLHLHIRTISVLFSSGSQATEQFILYFYHDSFTLIHFVKSLIAQ